jgi:hypothetical protein
MPAYNPDNPMWRHPVLWLVAATIALAAWFLYFGGW